MNWRERILADWPNDLQRAHRAKLALAELERAVSELASLGHPLHVEEGFRPPPAPEWPRVVFHIMAGQRTVNCQADLDELGPDWYPTMEEARHSAGLTKQNQRGGIFDRALPSLIRQTPEELKAVEEEEGRRKEAIRQFVSDKRLENRSQSNGKVDMPGLENALYHT